MNPIHYARAVGGRTGEGGSRKIKIKEKATYWLCSSLKKKKVFVVLYNMSTRCHCRSETHITKKHCFGSESGLDRDSIRPPVAKSPSCRHKRKKILNLLTEKLNFLNCNFLHCWSSKP
jgi:hypothetical protein